MLIGIAQENQILKVGKRIQMLSRPLIEQIKKSIVFLGRVNQDQSVDLQATGFLVSIDSVDHLVTAKHVVFDSGRDEFIDTNMVVLLNTTDRTINARHIDGIKRVLSCNWIFHPNRDVDVAIIPFGIQEGNDDIKVIPRDYFLPADELFENLDVFFLSYQPGIEPKEKILPILRRGAISVMNEDTTFFIDAASFPGNSGSPVFLSPSMMLTETASYTVSPGGKFIGVIGGYIPYQEEAVSLQTGHRRIIFEENTGLSKAWSIRFINEIIDSQAFKQQVGKIQSNSK